MRTPKHLLLPAAALVFTTLCPAAEFAGRQLRLTPLDGFEDASPWLKGDPNTDLKQRDAAVTTNTTFVKEGKRSLAFLLRVNWTPRPGEKYPKGWPMMRRTFAKPQDWSRYDYLCFWLYAKTSASLEQERVLRVGFPSAGAREIDWYTIPGIVPNKWIQVAAPLNLAADKSRITGVTFYAAEQWYHDGDNVDFYLDDMRLARLTAPRLTAFSATSRVFPRGTAVALFITLEGPLRDAELRCRVLDPAGNEQVAVTRKPSGSKLALSLPLRGMAAGGRYAQVELLVRGKVVDTRKQYFRSLQPGKRCYLKLITFYTKPLGKMTPETLAVLNDSAYAGVAIPLSGSYVTAPVPSFDSLRPQLDAVRKALRIDPWPWVALNRMIGAPKDRRGHAGSHSDNLKYFLSIKGMDLDNAAGARDDFLKLWRNALRAARYWKAPGVMLDPEAYNDYRTYQVQYLAETRGETVDQVIAGCEQLGADMAKTIAAEYPGCVVWTLFSRLERTGMLPGRKEKIYTSSSYIALGLLKYAREHEVPVTFLCGGETTPGYCDRSVDSLKQKIARRDAAVAPILEQFPHRFFLAGTISPFHDYHLTSGWIQRGYKGAGVKTIADFQPLFKTLFDAYDWVWIYASSAAQTRPYDPANNRLYSRALKAALDASAGGKGG